MIASIPHISLHPGLKVLVFSYICVLCCCGISRSPNPFEFDIDDITVVVPFDFTCIVLSINTQNSSRKPITICVRFVFRDNSTTDPNITNHGWMSVGTSATCRDEALTRTSTYQPFVSRRHRN